MPKITLRDKNRITLPLEMVPSGIERFDVEKDERGRIVLTPLPEIPADQEWFWSAKWQEGERKASEDIKANRLRSGTADEIMSEIRKRRKLK